MLWTESSGSTAVSAQMTSTLLEVEFSFVIKNVLVPKITVQDPRLPTHIICNANLSSQPRACSKLTPLRYMWDKTAGGLVKKLEGPKEGLIDLKVAVSFSMTIMASTKPSE